jgi:hypothetical protein
MKKEREEARVDRQKLEAKMLQMDQELIEAHKMVRELYF